MESNNIKNLCTGSSNTNLNKGLQRKSKIEIPPQLASFPGVRFIIIDKKIGEGKKPKERKWTTDKNYAYNNPKLQGHVCGGGNYGIATGFGWLHCFDADEVARLKKLGILQKLPQTLTVRTGGDGLHYWYYIEGMQKRIVFFDPELRDARNPEQYLHLGEVQSKGNYAIGPNCIHKSGKRYEIVDNSPIVSITYEQLMEILEPLRLNKKDNRQDDVKYERIGCNQHAYMEVDIEKIGWPRGNVVKYQGPKGIEFKGAHPFHSSRHGQNFTINPSRGIWHCFSAGHDSGGGWVELLAVKEGIISCERAGKNCLSKAQYRQVMQRAEELGLIEETAVDAPIKEILMDTEEVVQIPRRIPNGDMVVIVAPPRTGKTYSVVQWLADNGSGNYITHTHAIVEHAIKIAKELRITSAVWVVGINQPGACRQDGNCTKCLLRTTKKDFYAEERAATKLLAEKGVLTVADVPASMCPYHTLKKAEKHAKYCFTVVNNINSIIPRNLTILDEEPVLSHFYATSIEVATFKTRIGENTSKNFIAKSKQLQFELDQIINHGKKPNLKEYAEKLQEISRISDQAIEDGWKAEELRDEIWKILIEFDPKHREVREEGDKSNGDELSLESCVRCLGHLYKENQNNENQKTVCIVNKSGGYLSIYILGDERQTSYAMDWKDKTEKVIIIGATKAMIFAKEFDGRKLVINDFRYDERFLLIGVDPKKIGDQRGNAQAQKKAVIDMTKAIWKNSESSSRMPFLVLTGSKREQENAAKWIPGATKLMNERESGMEAEYINGKPGIFFQNSVISRGLDVDQYNLLFVYGCNFAQPFWHVADPGIESAIIADETTNSVLRISSTLRRDIKTMKVIIMRKDDLRKVKYLTNRVIMSENANKIAAILKKLGIGGLVSKRGRDAMEVTDRGINFEKGKAKFLEMRSSTDEIVDDEMTKTVIEKIVNFVREQSRKRKKSVTTHGIEEYLGNGCSHELMKSALAKISFDKTLDMEKVGRSHRWSPRKKKTD